MSEKNPSKSKKNLRPLPPPVSVPKWPFLFADIVFIGLGYWISTLIQGEAELWQVASILSCAVLGAGFAVAPFYFEYSAESKAIEIPQLTSVVKEVSKMEEVGELIADASKNWENIQDASAQTAKLADEIAAGIAATVKDHDKFMATANSEQLATLKFEVEKLRRSETNWANSLINVLDLVYRLERSAAESGKKQFIETMGLFQNQCRDVARRAGLVAIIVKSGTPFDSEVHRLPNDGQGKVGKNISETLLPGYRLQGKLMRKPLVRLN